MKSFSITGNIYVDGLVATTAFGMMKGWLDVFLTMMKTILEFIWVRIRYYSMKRISSQLGGTELYKVSYEPPCEVYYFLKKYVLNQNGDHMDNEFKRLHIKKFFEPYYWYHFDKEESVEGDLEVDYLGKSTIRSKDEKKTCKKDKIFFKYYHKGNHYVFSFYEVDPDFYRKYRSYYFNDGHVDVSAEDAKKKKNDDTTIWMEMASFSSQLPTQKERAKITEEFLNDRFNMHSMLYRTYCVILTEAVGHQYYNAVGRRYIDRENSLATKNTDLKVIDIFMEGVEIYHKVNQNPDVISASTTLIFDVKQLHSGFKYQKQLSLANRSSRKSSNIVSSLVHRYISNQYMFGNREFLSTWQDCLVFFDPSSAPNPYRLYIVTKGRKLSEEDAKEIIQHLIEISFKSNTQDKDIEVAKSQVTVYKRENNEWNSYLLSKRSFDSIYLPVRLMRHIRNEFDGFIEIEKLYQQYQIPYKKGILFYGPPGTGKTSLVKALAYEYQLPLYIIDVNDEEINDDSIVTILNGLGNNGLKLLLFEDIDTAFADKEKVKNETKVLIQQQQQQQQQQKKVEDDKKKEPEQTLTLMNQGTNIRKKFLTYSGLLNALDGVMSNQSGVITIMTTNYIDRLGKIYVPPLAFS